MSEPRISNVTPKAPSAPSQNARRQGQGGASGTAGNDPFSALLAQSVESLDARSTGAPEAKAGEGTAESATEEASATTANNEANAAAGASSASTPQTETQPPVDPAALTKELVLDPSLRADAGAGAVDPRAADNGSLAKNGDPASGRLPGVRRHGASATAALGPQQAGPQRADGTGPAHGSNASTEAQDARPIETGLLRAVEQASSRAELSDRFAERLDALSGGASPGAAAAATSSTGVTGAGNSFGLPRYEAAPTLATYTIATPLDTPAWPEQFGHVVRLMSRDEIGSAEVRVHPAELGPIEVRLAIEGDRAEISFAAASPETRALLEAHMPKLREALESTGLQLSHTSVQAGPERDTQQSGSAGSGTAGGDTRNGGRRHDVTAEQATEVRITRRSDRIVDVFA